MKGGYLLVHHTHCDGDSDQATVGSHVCTMRMPTFERFAEEAMSVFKNGSITMVERYDFNFPSLCFGFNDFFVLYIIRIVGITDYEEMYSDVIKASSHIYGLTSIHGFRIVARPGALSSETGVDIHYVEDYSGGERWYPMPAPAHPGLGNFDALFQHPLDPDRNGRPMLVRDYYPVEEKGQRQHFCYEIVYASGDSKVFVLPCPSLPYEISRDIVIARYYLDY